MIAYASWRLIDTKSYYYIGDMMDMVDCVAIAANYWYMSQVTEVAGLTKYLVSDFAIIRELAVDRFNELICES